MHLTISASSEENATATVSRTMSRRRVDKVYLTSVSKDSLLNLASGLSLLGTRVSSKIKFVRPPNINIRSGALQPADFR